MKLLRIIFFLPLLCHGQDTLKASLGLSVGCNITRHYLQTIPLDRAAGFNIGIVGLIPVRDVFCVKSSASFSWMYSSYGFPYFKLRNQYAEFSLSAAARFRDEIIFSAGINHAQLLNSDFLRMDTESDWQAYPTHMYHSQQSIDMGLELKLQKNFSLLFDYFIPLKQYDTKNFRVGINIRLTGRAEKKRDNSRQAARAKAITQIKDLKNGTLLVRLRSAEAKTEWLKEAGKKRRAVRTFRRQAKENRKIVEAFRKSFSFCPVMFFYSGSSEKILEKDFRGIFLNDSLLPDSSLIPDTTKKFFIAEFTEPEADTQKYFSGYRLGTDTSGNRQTVKTYYGAPVAGYYVLLVRDSDFASLRKPFPYYADARPEAALKNFHALPFFPLLFLPSWNWSYEAVVSRLQDKLNYFYLNGER